MILQCLHQKSEVEKKLSSFTFQEDTSTESNILIKHLQEELRNYVSFCIPGIIFGPFSVIVFMLLNPLSSIKFYFMGNFLIYVQIYLHLRENTHTANLDILSGLPFHIQNMYMYLREAIREIMRVYWSFV